MSQLSVDSGQLPAGYKQTEHWIIPEDWDVKPLGELVHSVEYGSSAKSSSSGAMPVLRMGNLQDGQVDWDDLVYTDDEAEISKYQLNHNDVLFNRTNTVDLVGKTSIYKGEFPAIFAGYLIRINRKEELLDAEYLNYILNTNQAKKYSKLILSVAVSQANINGQKLKTYPIPVPPTLEEQQLIAQALSGVDTLITSLEKLIAKKRAIKTATMQQLLTGKKRLPEFEEQSSSATRFGELFDQTISKKTISENEDVTFIGMQDVSEDARIKGTNVLPFSEIKSGFTYFEKNDVLVAKITPCFENGKGAFLDNINTQVGFGSTEFHVLRAQKGNDPQYIYQQTLLASFRADLEAEMVGSAGHRRVPLSAIENYELPVFHSYKEQVAIGKILSDMDEEIESVKNQLTKTQQLKQGMMQELLTGRTRLI